MLARVSIVDYKGAVVFDKFVSPTMPKIAEAWPFQAVQQHVANLFKGKILVGHSIWNDLSVLGIPHPAVATRDVALYQPFRNALRSPHQSVGLSTLSFQLLCRRCQEGQINPSLTKTSPRWKMPGLLWTFIVPTRMTGKGPSVAAIGHALFPPARSLAATCELGVF
ncbi:hypothetical protein D9611_003134 [Ephemerocybe angulata]|uniref:Exonuclease domain-containing protein n=1 Tax=Ephemerocybe angulata TaxID=980116 RepID=A0A8H5C8C0_9AGAR|nr:hypothetical protein D9611_003134 [Tulosesus angulatus]